MLKCNVDKNKCIFKGVVLSDETMPIVYKIKDKAFCKDVTSIQFEDSCKLLFIPNTIFKFFPNLITLEVKSTELNCLEQRFFHHAKKLMSISIANNKIKFLHAETFIFAPSLTFIDLQNNQIEEIHDDAFVGLKNLDWLHINNNNLQNLKSEAFRPLTKLRDLNLKGNECINKRIYFKGVMDLNLIDTELVKSSKKSL